MEFPDVPDEDIYRPLTRSAMQQELDRQTERLERYFAEQMARQRRWMLGIAVSASAIEIAIIGILVAVS